MRFCLIAALAAAALAESGAPVGAATVASIVRADPKTGRLVRSIERPAARAGRKAPAAAWAEAAGAIDQYVREAAQRYDVDPLLVHSVIQVESNGDPFALSPKGAQGLMQLMPQTARQLAVKNSFSPAENIDGGVRYLKYLLTMFGDTPSPETLALAAYNAGPGAVIKHGGVPPYKETAQYVKKVASKWENAHAAAGTTPRPLQAAAQPEDPQIEEFVDSMGVVHIQTRRAP
ncbi:MAG: lytic transglycosylase domain-containing protein [Acidobacteriota bacterium]